ncbi:hypothetical protein HK096_009408 [Nowakowskiella sp. JEL0078]|nr:hypothetical protein HK096_009408 [Nowakowskiella sp. JEL0078]
MYLASKTFASPLQTHNKVPCIDSILTDIYKCNPAIVSQPTSKVSFFSEHPAKQNLDESTDCKQIRQHILEYLNSKPDDKISSYEPQEEIVSSAFTLTKFLENNSKANTFSETDKFSSDLDVESVKQIVFETLAGLTEVNRKLESSHSELNKQSQSYPNVRLAEKFLIPLNSSVETTPSWDSSKPVIPAESSVLLTSWSSHQTPSSPSQNKLDSIPSWGEQKSWNTSSSISNTSFSSTLQTTKQSSGLELPKSQHTPPKTNSMTIDLTAASTQHLLQLQTPNLTFEKSGWEDDEDNDDTVSVCSFTSTGTVQWAPVNCTWNSKSEVSDSNSWGVSSQQPTPISSSWSKNVNTSSEPSNGWNSQTTLTGWDSKGSETLDDDWDETDQDEETDDDVSKFWSSSWEGESPTNSESFLEGNPDSTDCDDTVHIKFQLAKADLEIARLNTLVMSLSTKVNESATANLFAGSRCDCQSLVSSRICTDLENTLKESPISQECQTTIESETELSKIVNLFSHYVLRTENEKRAMQNGISSLLTQIKECDEKFEVSTKICNDMKTSVKDTIENMKLEKTTLLNTIEKLTQKNTILTTLLDEKENTISELKKVFESENFKPVNTLLKSPRQLKRSFTWVGNNGIWTKVEDTNKEVEPPKLSVQNTTNTENNPIDFVNQYSVSNTFEETLICKTTELETLTKETSKNTEIAERKTSIVTEPICDNAQCDFQNTMKFDPIERIQYKHVSEPSNAMMVMPIEQEDTHSIPESPDFSSSTSETRTIFEDLSNLFDFQPWISGSPEQLPIDLPLNLRRSSSGHIYSMLRNSWTMSSIHAPSAELKADEQIECTDFLKSWVVEDTDLVSQTNYTNMDGSSTTISESRRAKFKRESKAGSWSKGSTGKRILRSLQEIEHTRQSGVISSLSVLKKGFWGWKRKKEKV